MTGRARWLLMASMLGVLAGTTRGQLTLSVFSAGVFVWIVCQWAAFQWRCWRQLSTLTAEREVNGRRKADDILWAGRQARVRLTLQCKARMRPIMEVKDVVPEIMELLGQQQPAQANPSFGSASETTPPLADNEYHLHRSTDNCQLHYSVRARAAGVARFPGVRVSLRDSLGLFRQHRLITEAQRFRILPAYFHSGERSPTVTRFSSLPRHGIHRLQRSGLGSELLELREYVPGDPPKSIAWKVSARRDTLMTRRYESEVPVRVNLLIDGSLTTRIGGYGQRLMDQINFVAASIAQAALSVGDPVSGTLVDDTRTRQLAWVSGDRGFHQFLTALTEFSDAPPPPSRWLTPHMMESAEAVIRERFPELLDRRFQRLPFSFFAANRRRFRLAVVVGELRRLSPREQYECYFDHSVLAAHLRHLLHDAGLAWMPPLISSFRVAGFSATNNVKQLGQALSRGVTMAKDNQVFVILGDVLSCAPNLDHLVSSIKLAVARHHRVAFVCPATTFERPDSGYIRPASTELSDLLKASEQARVRELSVQLKRDLGRLGVSLSFSGQESAIHMVLAEIEHARDGSTRGSGAFAR